MFEDIGDAIKSVALLIFGFGVIIGMLLEFVFRHLEIHVIWQ